MALSNVAALSQSAYETLAIRTLAAHEGRISKFYMSVDDPHPTIGIGFNIDAWSSTQVVALLTFALGSLTTDQKAGLNLVQIYKNGGTILINGKSQKLDEPLFSKIMLGTAGSTDQQRQLSSISLSTTQQENLLREMLWGASKIMTAPLDPAMTKALGTTGAIPTSVERVQLLDAYYNAPALIGAGVATAISNDSRAALWFEIRYLHLNQNMTRRIDESNPIDFVSNKTDEALIKKSLNTLFNGTSSGVDIYTIIGQRDSWITATAEKFSSEVRGVLDFLAKKYGFTSQLDMLQIADKSGQAITSKAAFDKVGPTNAILYADGGNNTLNGGTGNDLLVSAGNSTLIGGPGNDTYVISNAADKVVEKAGEGTDTIRTTLNSYSLASLPNVENLVFSGVGAFSGTGNAAANSITGGPDNDTLDGGAGADTLIGGAGNDTYLVDNSGDIVIENANEGVDTVLASIISYALPANVENLTFIGTAAASGTGNALANTIIGNTSNNTLDGGLGNDQLTGGLGADKFLFDTTLDSAQNVDTITDFSEGQGDKIGLSPAIFAALMKGASLSTSDFYASTTGIAHLKTDHILYNTTTGALSYDVDGNGAGAAVKFAVLAGHPTLAARDFVLS